MEKEERSFSVLKYSAVFAFACLIFIAGIFSGSLITESKVNDILNVERESRIQLENLELEEKLLKETPCIKPSLLSNNLDDLGTKLTYLETEYPANDEKVLELKRPYTLLEVRHYLAMKSMIENCNQNYTLILFFYSNSPEKVDESKKQGFVLDYLKKKYGNVKIYSFDTDLDVDIIKILMKKYGISNIPSVIINDKVYVGYHGKEELEGLFNPA